MLKEFSWFINGFLVLFLIYLTFLVFKGKPADLVKVLIREPLEFVRRRFTVGSINFLGFVVMSCVGVGLVVMSKMSVVVNFIIPKVGPEKAQSLLENPGLFIFFGLLFFLMFSIWAVLANENLKDRARRSKKNRKP